MSFWIGSKMEVLNAITDPTERVASNPDMAARFDAIADHRNHHQEIGTTLKTPEWKHIASIEGPLLNLAECLEPGFFSDKRAFYKWAKYGNEGRNRAYLVYDARFGRMK